MKNLAFASLVLALALGCDVGNRPVDGEDGSVSIDSGGFDATTGRDTGVARRDGGRFDPFDPANACGLSAIPTQRVPGSLLIVFDRSGSMGQPADGDSGPSKWDLARAGMNSVLTSVSDELSAGLMLFPTGSGSECSITLGADVPRVPIAPLSTSRAMISSALSSASASSSETPAHAAMRAGYDYLDTLTTPGQRGIVLVTDGAETCERSDAESDAMIARVMMERAESNYLTFAVGMHQTNNFLSAVALNGGTPRNDTCRAECSSDLCTSSADCPGGAPCQMFAGFGVCGCESDAHCISPQTCNDPCGGFPGCPLPRSCGGENLCCHYDASKSDFQAEFEAALAEIARRLLDSCVFEVPRGENPSEFDPTLVNVGVTFDGESRTVLPNGDDASMNSWKFVPGTDNENLVIQGDICERLLDESATVEIVLGCPTILI